MKNMASTIPELEQEIRDLITAPRQGRLLRSQKHIWHQVCASLDVIGDSQLAIDAFPASQDGKRTGALYLSLYGLLQACFLQQDAVDHLAEALSIRVSYKDHSQLAAIRELRNDAAGHPTKRNRRPPYRHCSISRVSLSPRGFTILTEQGDQRSSRYVNLWEIIVDQQTYICQLLASVLATLRQEVAGHKEQFRMEKLEAYFPPTLGYAFAKVSQGIYECGPESAAHAGLGLSFLPQISEVIATIREALERRGLEVDPFSGTGDLIEEMHYPLERLEAFLRAKHGNSSTPIDEQTAAIFLDYLRRKLDDLRKLTREVDAEYAA